jgi:hypothetical protein
LARAIIFNPPPSYMKTVARRPDLPTLHRDTDSVPGVEFLESVVSRDIIGRQMAFVVFPACGSSLPDSVTSLDLISNEVCLLIHSEEWERSTENSWAVHHYRHSKKVNKSPLKNLGLTVY